MRKNTTDRITANFEAIDINLIARVFLSFMMMAREDPVIILKKYIYISFIYPWQVIKAIC